MTVPHLFRDEIGAIKRDYLDDNFAAGASPFFSITGARPGEPDSTAAIQAAVDSAFNQGGGIVWVPGFFNTSAAILLKDNVTLMGAGSGVAGFRLTNNAAAVVEHVSPAVVGARRAARKQSIVGLTLQHLGLPVNRNTFPLANGIAIRDYGAFSISASDGHYDDVLILDACDGINIGGELFATNIGTIEFNYNYRPVNKTGTGFCTSLTIQMLRMFACFHGVRFNNTVYSVFSLYADNCGLNVNGVSWGAANEMPIMMDIDNSIITIATYGMEFSPAVNLRASGFSKINILASNFAVSTAQVFVASAVRISNIPQVQQAFLASVSNTVLSWASFDLTLQTASGYPTAAVTQTDLLYVPAADTSRITLSAALVYCETYYWCANALVSQYPLPFTIYGVNFELNGMTNQYAIHRVFGLIRLLTTNDAGIFDGTYTPVDGSGAGLVFAAASGTVSQRGKLVTIVGTLTYPVTASGAAAMIGGFPVPTRAATPFSSGAVGFCNAAVGPARAYAVNASSVLNLINAVGVAITNVNMSGSAIAFSLTYAVD